MDYWNLRRPDPWLPEYWDQQSTNSRDSWPPEYQDQQSAYRRDQRSPEYWNQQSVDSRNQWSPGSFYQQSVNCRDQWSSEYLDQQSIDSWPSTLPSDIWLANSRDQQPTYLGDPRPSLLRDPPPTFLSDPYSSKHRYQHPIGYKNSRSQERYPKAHESIRRPSWNRGSSVSHEPRFQRSSYRNYSAFHPYGRSNQMSSYHHRKDLRPVASTGNCANLKAVGNHANLKAVPVNTSRTNSASKKTSSFTSNAANKKDSKKPKTSLQAQAGNNDTISEDVHYLFSVDRNDEGKLVELVDLSENSQISEDQGILTSDSNNTYMPANSNYEETSDSTTLKDSTCDDLTKLNNEKNNIENMSKVQDECGGAYCNMCNKNYEELHNNKCDLYIARCGHLFCVLCIPHLKIKNKCIKCKNTISNLRKIFM